MGRDASIPPRKGGLFGDRTKMTQREGMRQESGCKLCRPSTGSPAAAPVREAGEASTARDEQHEGGGFRYRSSGLELPGAGYKHSLAPMTTCALWGGPLCPRLCPRAPQKHPATRRRKTPRQVRNLPRASPLPFDCHRAIRNRTIASVSRPVTDPAAAARRRPRPSP
jgi:hypothetical protein